jgi:hypothetical protein
LARRGGTRASGGARKAAGKGAGRPIDEDDEGCTSDDNQEAAEGTAGRVGHQHARSAAPLATSGVSTEVSDGDTTLLRRRLQSANSS